MGSHAILVGAIALGTALICLFSGYRWGRANVRSQIEDALDMARGSADAREFSLREQLDEKMLEVAELRARADEAKSLKEQLAQLQSSQRRSSPEASTETADQSMLAELHASQSAAVIEEDPVQRFFHPKRNTGNGASPEPKAPPAAKFPASFSTVVNPPPPATTAAANLAPMATPVPNPAPTAPSRPKLVVEAKPAPAPVPAPAAAKPAAIKPAAVRPVPLARPNVTVNVSKPPAAANNDDWDEFAKSLEALKKLQK